MIEDESEEPSRVGTPSIGEKVTTMAEGNAPTEAGASGESKEKAAEKAEGPTQAPELPPEIRTKLRKYEKLESKYQGKVICWLG